MSLNFQDFLYKKILPSLAWAAIRALTATLRVETVGKEIVEDLQKQNRRFIYAFWHGRQFLLVHHLSKIHLCVMSSTSRDGRLQAKILSKFGFRIVWGSSNKQPVRALLGAVKTMNTGYDLAIAVDGPTGPIYNVKPGVLFIAKKTNAVIIPTAFSASPSITAKSWDEYLLPKPFSKVTLIYSSPIEPSQDTSDDAIESESKQLELELNRISKQADNIVGRITSN